MAGFGFIPNERKTATPVRSNPGGASKDPQINDSKSYLDRPIWSSQGSYVEDPLANTVYAAGGFRGTNEAIPTGGGFRGTMPSLTTNRTQETIPEMRGNSYDGFREQPPLIEKAPINPKGDYVYTPPAPFVPPVVAIKKAPLTPPPPVDSGDNPGAGVDTKAQADAKAKAAQDAESARVVAAQNRQRDLQSNNEGPTENVGGRSTDMNYSDFGDGGSGGGASSGSSCVIATHGVATGGFTVLEKAKAELWCQKKYHGKWYGEAFRKGYRNFGLKRIKDNTVKAYYQEFKDFVSYGRRVKKGWKLALNYYYRTITFFIVGLFIGED